MFDTPSFTHHLWHTIFHTHHLSHTIFRHTIFHTPLCLTPSFTHHFVSHHLSAHHLSHTMNFVAHHLSPHHLSHTHRHNFVTHHLSPHHLLHTTLSHTIFHTPSLSLAFFHTQLSHTPSFTHNFVTHTIFLCHTPSFTYNFVTHNFVLLLDPPPPSLSFLPSPSPLQLLIIGKSCLVGLSGPLILSSGMNLKSSGIVCFFSW